MPNFIFANRCGVNKYSSRSKVGWSVQGSVVTMQKISKWGRASTNLAKLVRVYKELRVNIVNVVFIHTKSMKRYHRNIPKPKVPYEYGMTV